MNNLYLDPPTLRIKENIQCNISSSVEIICDSLGVAVIYDDWYHFFNGSFVKKMKGEHIGNRLSISIGSCGVKDSGTYMCKAGYTIENETFWINVSTNLEFYGKVTYLAESLKNYSFFKQAFVLVLIVRT